VVEFPRVAEVLPAAAGITSTLLMWAILAQGFALRPSVYTFQCDYLDHEYKPALPAALPCLAERLRLNRRNAASRNDSKWGKA